VVVIENGRFRTVGRTGEVAIPAGAQVIDAKGKHSPPGFLDGHCQLGGLLQRALFASRTNHHLHLHRDLPGRPLGAGATRGVPLRSARSAAAHVWVAGQAIGGPRTERPTRRIRSNGVATSSSRRPRRRAAAVRKKKAGRLRPAQDQRVHLARSAQGDRRRGTQLGTLGHGCTAGMR